MDYTRRILSCPADRQRHKTDRQACMHTYTHTPILFVHMFYFLGKNKIALHSCYVPLHWRLLKFAIDRFGGVPVPVWSAPVPQCYGDCRKLDLLIGKPLIQLKAILAQDLNLTEIDSWCVTIEKTAIEEQGSRNMLFRKRKENDLITFSLMTKVILYLWMAPGLGLLIALPKYCLLLFGHPYTYFFSPSDCWLLFKESHALQWTGR